MELGTKVQANRLMLLLGIDATVVGRNSSKSDSINGCFIMTMIALWDNGDDHCLAMR